MATNKYYEEDQKNQLALLENHWGSRHAWFDAVKVKEELQYKVSRLKWHNAQPRFVPQKIQFTSEQFDELQEQADYDRFCQMVDERQTSIF